LKVQKDKMVIIEESKEEEVNVVFVDATPMTYDLLTPQSSPLGGTQQAIVYVLTELGRMSQLAGHVFFLNNCSSAKFQRGVQCLPIEKNAKKIHEQLQQLRATHVIFNSDAHVAFSLIIQSSDIRRYFLWEHYDTNCVAATEDIHFLKDYISTFFFVSEWQSQKYQSQFQIPASKCAVIRNGVSPPFQSLLERNFQATKMKLWPSPFAQATTNRKPGPVLCYLSAPFRGLALLLDMFPKIKQALPNASLRIFSSMKTYQQEDTCFQDIFKKCKELEPSGVSYRGSLPAHELAIELSQCDIFVYPSYFLETSCIVALEAMAAGCSVVTTTNGALPETVQDYGQLIKLSIPDCYETSHDYVQTIWLNQLQSSGQEFETKFIQAILEAHATRTTTSNRDPIEQEKRQATLLKNQQRLLQEHTWKPIAYNFARILLNSTSPTSTKIPSLQDLCNKGMEYFRLQLWHPASLFLKCSLQKIMLDATSEQLKSLRELVSNLYLNLGVCYIQRHNQLMSEKRQRGKDVTNLELLSKGIEALKTSYDHCPQFHTLRNLGIVLSDSKEFTEAIKMFEQALKLRFDKDTAMRLLQLYNDNHSYELALGMCSNVLLLFPGDPAVLNYMACIYKAMYRHAEAAHLYESAWRKALELKDQDAVYMILSNDVMCQLYCYDSNPFERFHRSKLWQQIIEKPLLSRQQQYQLMYEGRLKFPHAKLRIGYVTSDNRLHPVGKTLQSLLKHHHYDQFDIFGYDLTKAKRDFLTNELLNMQGIKWRRNLSSEPNDKIIQLILQDEIDILVDMLGHTDGGANRLEIFAVKPCPAIVSYFSYPGTMGMTSIGYKFADKFLVPPGNVELEKCYFEKIIRLEGGISLYESYDQAPPTKKRVDDYTNPDRQIRFCCLNNPQKFNSTLIETWANILNAVPRSILYFRFFFFSNALLREGTIQEFAKHGIAEDRLNFGVSTIYEYLDLYNQSDVALDCFPYNGGMTSTETLFYGVPLVTLAGKDYVGRVGVSLLSFLGCPELIANTIPEYIEIAVNLAKNPDRLRHYHNTLNNTFKTLPMGNGKLFIDHFENGLRQVWKETTSLVNQSYPQTPVDYCQ
jgi:protein O-GlcNAc transferase